jgi:hypothetical protein
MGYKMKRGNSTVPFKELGSSPAKQAVGGGAGEAIKHWEEFKKKAGKVGKKVIKTGKKAIKTAGKRNPYVLAASMLIGKTSKADQPVEGKGKVEYPGGKIDFTSED